jgi:surface antigen
VSVADALARVGELQTQIQRALSPTAPPPARQSSTALPTQSSLAFSHVLSGAIGMSPSTLRVGGPQIAVDDSAGERMLSVAQAEVGVAEAPPGSNDGERIAEYRTAVAGSYPGAPWCAYFVSWAAAQAGTPIGDTGQGYGAVSQIADWGARTGRLLPAGAEPQPGDIILFGSAHVGLVESVNPDGSLTTVEGNSSQAVSRVQRQRSEATGFVRL